MADFGRVDIEWPQREAIKSAVVAFKGRGGFGRGLLPYLLGRCAQPAIGKVA